MNAASLSQLLYVADPMCSWCYGFAPSLAELRRAYSQLPVELVMGGLRDQREPIDEAMRGRTLAAWQRVAQHSGQRFVESALFLPGFAYTTEPACRAVIAVRDLAPDRALDCFSAIQTAFYAEGRDVTRAEELGDLVASLGLPREEFERRFGSDELRSRTAAEFAQVAAAGIGGFPTLLLRRAERTEVLAAGWMPPAALLERAAALGL
jgi:putative protein-disulfide isomerase